MKHVHWLFVAALAVTLFGFWPSFFSDPAQLDVWRLGHGVFATLWILLLILQAWLIGHKRRTWHRGLGRTSILLLPPLLITAGHAVYTMLSAGPEGLPRDLRLTLAYVDMTSLVMFVVCWGLAIRFSRHRTVHAGLMGTTALIAVIPALGRALAHNVPSLGGLDGALDPSFRVVEGVLFILLLERLFRRRSPLPYPFLITAFILMQLTMRQAPHWAPFVALARLCGFHG